MEITLSLITIGFCCHKARLS